MNTSHFTKKESLAGSKKDDLKRLRSQEEREIQIYYTMALTKTGRNVQPPAWNKNPDL